MLGGGRYDGLIETLGGPHTPAVGWAAGIERLAMLIEAPEEERVEVAVLPTSDSLLPLAAEVGACLRRAGISCTYPERFRSPQKLFDKYFKAGVPFTLEISDAKATERLAHARLVFGNKTLPEIQQHANAIEDALRGRFRVIGMSQERQSSTGWELLEGSPPK